MKLFRIGVMFAILALVAGCGDGGTSSNTCAAGQSRVCTTTCGSQGSQVCIGGQFSATCTPPSEICNQKDDNCNGQADEGGVCGGTTTQCTTGATQNCATACQSTGTQVCGANSQWGVCTPPQETCNQKDDNCDGAIDEGGICGECTAGMTEQCVTSCNTVGTRTCGQDSKWAPCAAPPEVCNAKDDNCNGQTDENVVEVCSNQCGEGVKICQNGQMLDCTAPLPSAEECDGKDNDCDGATDEGANNQQLTQTCGEECGGGTQTCANGVWSECSAVATEEVCDGKDNDCDGATDEVCNCQTGQTKECGLGVGICGKGTQTCQNGMWTDCSGPNYKAPEPEVCDGIDNDCDGIVDCEGLSIEACKAKMAGIGQACGTANKNEFGNANIHPPCKLGFQFCQGGQIACSGVDPLPEVCDNIDNDCDGQTDEIDGAGGDQFESNNSCSAAASIGAVTEGYTMTVTGGTIYPGSDIDWYIVEAQEASGLSIGDENFKITIKLDGIPADHDYDLCVWPSNKEVTYTDKSGQSVNQPATGCGSIQQFADLGNCEDLNIYQNGTTPETYTATWSGKWLQNDDRTFYVMVLDYFQTVEQCTQPYQLTITLEGI